MHFKSRDLFDFSYSLEIHYSSVDLLVLWTNFKTDIIITTWDRICIRRISYSYFVQTVQAVRFSGVVWSSKRIFITRKKMNFGISWPYLLLNVEHEHASSCHPLWRLVAINCLMFHARTAHFADAERWRLFSKAFFPKAQYKFTSGEILFYVEAFCIARVWMHS